MAIIEPNLQDSYTLMRVPLSLYDPHNLLPHQPERQLNALNRKAKRLIYVAYWYNADRGTRHFQREGAVRVSAVQPSRAQRGLCV